MSFEVIKDLNGVTLEVTEKDDLKPLYNLLKNWFGDDTEAEVVTIGKNKGRTSYSDEEKSDLVKMWKKAQAAGKNNLAEFAREQGVKALNLRNWIKKDKEGKSK